MAVSQLKGMRCLGLCRASSDPQAETSIPQQVEGLRKASDEREMIWVGFEQETVSGTEPGNRDDIARLLERKKNANDYDVLLVWDRSRLTRAGQNHATWLKVEFGRHGVRVVSMTSKMGDSRFSWIEEGMEDEAAHDYVVKLSRNNCRGKQWKVEAGHLPYTEATPFALDRLILNADGKPLHIIRNLPDGRQLRLNPETKEQLEVYPREQKGCAKRHFRKQKTDKVIFIPGTESSVEMIRFIMEQYWKLGLGYHRIKKLMNAKGWQSPEGSRWHTSTVRRIAFGTIYTGRAMSNVWATGKFNIRDRGQPREVDYDLYKMMNMKRPKETLRPPEDWVIIEQASLFCILGDDLREEVWKCQYEYWVKFATGLLPAPDRDKHKFSSFFLKHILRCKLTGKGLVGRSSSKHRYYNLSAYVNDPDPTRPWLSKLVPAELVEDKVKVLIREALLSPEVLTPIIRETVKRELERSESSVTEIASLAREMEKVEQQVGFALTELSDIGEEAVRKIVRPLKERKHELSARLAQLRSSPKGDRLDLDATVNQILDELFNVGNALDGMPTAVLTTLLQSFLKMEIDMESRTIDVDVMLPTWAIHKAGTIQESFGVVSPAYCRQANEANSVLASYNCLLHKEKQGRFVKPCITCERRIADRGAVQKAAKAA